MAYYFNKTIHSDFDSAIERVTAALKEEGFGIITEIDLKSTFKKKLDKDFRNYKILGACNPGFAFEALQREDKIGTMLPCNVIVQEMKNGDVEVAAVNPMDSMAAVKNEGLKEVAAQVEKKMKKVVNSL